MKGYKLVAEGIYRHSRTGHLFERLRVDDKDTCIKLPATTLAEARRIRAERLVKYAQAKEGIGGAVNPYSARHTALTVGECIDEYRNAGCPDQRRAQREGKALACELSRLKILEQWWASVCPTEIRHKLCDDYADWRKRQKFAGKRTKGRAIDLELNTLNCCLSWAERRELLAKNPLGKDRPNYGPKEEDVRHCSMCRPTSGDELHALAEWLLARESQRSEVLGWQYLFEAMTGVRTSEALRMRWDAPSGKAGYIESGKFLHIQRSKHGIAPWVEIHSALETLLGELRAWNDERYDSPWFFPSPMDPTKHIDCNSLGHGLRRACKALGMDIRTPHGARSFYVTVRRSQRVPDNIIAAEIGHTTGGATLIRAYGSVPQNWYIASHPELSWLPATREPAWAVLSKPDSKVIRLAVANPPDRQSISLPG